MTIPEVLVSEPPVAVEREEPGDLKLVSVTTILNNLGKDALIYWSAEQTALAALDDNAVITAMLEGGRRKEALEYLTKARFRSSEDKLSATELGTRVHSIAETLARGYEPDFTDMHPQVEPLARNLCNWWEEVQPEPIATELTVFHPGYGYAGSADLFVKAYGRRVILDFKTSAETHYKSGKERGPYPEQVGLQLSAYRHASHAATFAARRIENWSRRYYLLSEEEAKAAVPVPEVDDGLVVHITPGWCRAYPIVCDVEVFDYFLHLIEIHRWVNDLSKEILGKPLSAGDEFASERKARTIRKGTVLLPPTGVEISGRPF